MYLLYNVVLILGSILALPFYSFKMITAGKYRRSFLQKLGFLPKKLTECLDGKSPIWFHAVSVGEVLSSISIIRMIRDRYPNRKIILSTVTETGNYTANSRLTGIDSIIYFPLDYPWVVKRVIDAVNPLLFVIVDTDIWPNFLRELRKQQIPSIIINGRVSPRSYRGHRWFKWFFKAVLECLSFFSMQSKVDSDRIIRSGADATRVVTTGNLKFDQTVPDLTEAEKERLLASMGLKPDQRVFIAGSTHKGEEDIVLDVFEVLKGEYPDLVLILAPRNPERFTEVENLASQRSLNCVRKTRGKERMGGSPTAPTEVIILDTIGELCKIYSVGLLVFVGGSLVKIGGHNLLEPAAYKKAVIFGPYMHNFLEISGVLKDSGGGIQVRNKDEFLFQARRLLGDPSLLHRLGEAAYSVIEKNQGATLRNMEIIDRFIRPIDVGSPRLKGHVATCPSMRKEGEKDGARLR
ncbi:MAG: 3-deoxy-D-manno-octulosonic acid transferase [Desulfobacterales bacterium]|nr:3-deoxy-D-manno-octulosonic acid transferase [Desulfobacterales bacterium]